MNTVWSNCRALFGRELGATTVNYAAMVALLVAMSFVAFDAVGAEDQPIFHDIAALGAGS